MSKQEGRLGDWQWGWAGWFEQVEQDLVLIPLRPADAALILTELSNPAPRQLHTCSARRKKQGRVLFLVVRPEPGELQA